MGKTDRPEDEPGLIGMLSQTNRVEGIKKDRYYTYLEWYWPPSFLFTGPGRTYRRGDEKPYLDITDHPLRLTVGKQRMENRYFGEMPSYEYAEAILKNSGAPAGENASAPNE
jgi:hypothetical protein